MSRCCLLLSRQVPIRQRVAANGFRQSRANAAVLTEASHVRLLPIMGADPADSPRSRGGRTGGRGSLSAPGAAVADQHFASVPAATGTQDARLGRAGNCRSELKNRSLGTVQLTKHPRLGIFAGSPQLPTPIILFALPHFPR
jgi:hypothetical protein